MLKSYDSKILKIFEKSKDGKACYIFLCLLLQLANLKKNKKKWPVLPPVLDLAKTFPAATM